MIVASERALVQVALRRVRAAPGTTANLGPLRIVTLAQLAKAYG
jgi:hypothetical protein